MKMVAVRSVLCIGVGLGVLLGLEPFGSVLGGIASGVCLLALSHSLRGARATRIIGWGCVCSVAVGIIAFQWVLPGLRVMGGLSWITAGLLFVLQALLSNTRIPLMLLLTEALHRRLRLPRALYLTVLAGLGDMGTWQLFPWFWGNLLGGSDALLQTAAVFGAYGLSMLFFLTAWVVWGALRLLASRRLAPRAVYARLIRLRPRRLLPLWGPALLVLCALIFGLWRLSDSALLEGEPVRVGFVQPNTGKGLRHLKTDRAFAAGAVNRSFNSALRIVFQERAMLDLIVLPESAIPFHGTRPAAENQGIYSRTFHGMVLFIAELAQADVLYNELDRRSGKLHNQAHIMGVDGRRRTPYSKRRLVPFGEYLPLESHFPSLRRLFPEASRYVPARTAQLLTYQYDPTRYPRQLLRPSPESLQLIQTPEQLTARMARVDRSAGLKTGRLGALICYEGLFPYLARDLVIGSGGRRADFLVNLSNDTWFGDYLENYQHSSGVRVRSIETGRYLLRATLSGHSVAYDPLGRPLTRPTELGRTAVRAVVLRRRPNAVTPYLLLGRVAPLLAAVLLLLASLALHFVRKQRSLRRARALP